MIAIEEYSRLSLKQLWNLCRYHEVTGYSNMRLKSQLVLFIHGEQLVVPDFIKYEKKGKIGRPMKKVEFTPIDEELYNEENAKHIDQMVDKEKSIVN